MPIQKYNSEPSFSDGHIYFRRAHIHNLLEKSVEKPVVSIVAGAGYGKTQAVNMFLHEYDAITMWVQLTMLDNLGVRFWKNLINVLSQRKKTLEYSLEMLGLPETDVKFDMFLSDILENMDLNSKYVIVYDDFHLLHEKKTLRFIEKFIHAGIPNLSFMLISRNEPGINIAKLIATGMVANINEDDLCFSKNEVVDYYGLQNIHLPPQLIPKIYSATGGWIMAIRLIEYSIRRGVAHEEYAITAMKLNIYKLMESDIYSPLSEKTKAFLAKLSLFDSLPMELVEELSAHNKALITDISQINSFIRFDSFSSMYCVHHLFLDFLRQKQDTLTPDEKTACFQKAADWYASNGYIIDAITYYGKAGDYEGILKIALFWPHASSEEGALILDILNKAPKQLRERNLMMANLFARALWFAGKPAESIAEMDKIIQKCGVLPQTPENISIVSEMYISIGLSYYYFTNYYPSSNDLRFVDYIIRAYKYVEEKKVSIQVNYGFQDVGTYVCRINSEKKEDMDAYLEAVKTAAYYAPKLMPGCMCGMDDLTQAELFYFKNLLKEAKNSANQALHKAREHRQHAIAFRSIFYLVRVHLAEGSYVEIQDCIKQLDLQLEIENSPVYKTLYDIVIAWFCSLIGQGEKSASWVKNNLEYVELNPGASGSENLAKVKYYLYAKKHSDLLTFLELPANASDLESFLFGKISIAATKAICLYHTGQKEQAISMLWEAYRLAEPNALTMNFIELGNDMVALTKFALKSENCAMPKEWLKTLLTKSSTYAKRLSHVASEYKRANHLECETQIGLSKKELELLNDVFHGLSRTEIASNYGLSPNYVRNRLKTIYAKLGAENANDAIRIALLKRIIK